MKIGDKIRVARTLRRVSQEKMSEYLEMSPKNYGNLERGIYEIKFSQVENICKVLNINMIQLLQIEI